MPRVTYIRPISRVGMRVFNQTHPAHAAALSGLAHYSGLRLGAQPMPLPLAQSFQGPAICLGPTVNGVEQQIDCSDPNCTYGDCGSTNAPATSGLCLGPTINGVESPIDCNDPQCTYGDCVAPSGPQTSAQGPAQPSPTTSAQPAAGVPTGSMWIYQATINAHLFASDSVGSFLSQLPGMLSPKGIQVVNSNYSSSFSTFQIQLTLQITGSGFAQPNDLKSVVDGDIYAQRGEMPMASSISAGGTTGGGGPSALNMDAFFSQNMTWILLGLGAVLVLPSLTKR